MYVVVDNHRVTRLLYFKLGVLQVTILAPLLFLIYIYDLPSCVYNKARLNTGLTPSKCHLIQQM